MYLCFCHSIKTTSIYRLSSCDFYILPILKGCPFEIRPTYIIDTCRNYIYILIQHMLRTYLVLGNMGPFEAVQGRDLRLIDTQHVAHIYHFNIGSLILHIAFEICWNPNYCCNIVTSQSDHTPIAAILSASY